MNTRAWLRVVEAFFAVLIIIGVFFFQIRDISPGTTKNIIVTEKTLLKEISGNITLREEILQSDLSGGPVTLTSSSNATISKYIADRMPSGVDFAVMICHVDESCLLQGNGIVAHDLFIASTIHAFNPRKLRLFMWEQ